MFFIDKNKKRRKLLNKELSMNLSKQQKLHIQAMNTKEVTWKSSLEKYVPKKVYASLEVAYIKSFAFVFKQGKKIIEKTYNKKTIQEEYKIKQSTFDLKGKRKDLKQISNKSDLWNVTMTTAEGVALGALGVGIPDIALFLANLLKGIYETALSYGFEYDSKEEQLFILKMMETAMSTGNNFIKNDHLVDSMMEVMLIPSDEDLMNQMNATASIFALDMLLLKFVQGFAIVGILGGMANPIYYNKVMKYVKLKYQQRYLMKEINKLN